MDPEKNRFSGKVYTRRAKKMGISPSTTTSITLPETSKVLKSKKVPPRTQDLLISNSTTSGVVPNGCCRAGVVDGGYGGGEGSQPSENDEVATVIFANENPAVIGGVVERGKRIRKENKYYNNSEFLLAKDRLPYERPYGKSKKSKNNKKEKSSKRKAEVAQYAAITSSGSMVAAALKASGTSEMHISASSTHADNARSCSSD